MSYIASINSKSIPHFDQDVFDFLRANAEGAELYELKKFPVMASRDTTLMRQRMRKVIGDINTVAGILSLALATYQAYDESEHPSRNTRETPVISIYIQDAGQENVYNFGTDIKTEEDLARKVKETLLAKEQELDVKKIQAALDSIRNSDEWKRIK